MKRRVWIGVIIVVAILAYSQFKSSTFPVSDAIEKGYVKVELRAGNGAECSVRLERWPGAPDNLTISIPAGTFIRNSDPGSQLLMTAKGVVVHLTQSQPSLSVPIETYCVNQFATEPTASSTLKFVPPATASVATAQAVGGSSAGGSYQEVGESVTVETEPLRKLAECLEKSSESRETRQLAVWLLSGHYLNMSYHSVHEQLRKHYSRIMAVQMRATMEDARSELSRNDPGLTEEQIRTVVERYTRNKLQRDLDTAAEERAQKDLRAFVTDGKRALQPCESSINTRYFFQTASSG